MRGGGGGGEVVNREGIRDQSVLHWFVWEETMLPIIGRLSQCCQD